MIAPPTKSSTRRFSCCLILLVLMALMIYPFLVSMEDYCVKKNNQNHEVIKVIEGTNISLSEMLTPTIIDSAGSNHTETKTMNTSITALRRQLLRRTHVTAAILDEQKLSTEIPKVIYQTYHHPEEIPPKVAANLAKYAADYQRFVLDDDKCIEFLTKHYHEAVIKTFGLLGGAHKADLFRYAILYLKGGVYLDIKTELLMPLESVFPPKSPGPRGITYTAIDAVGNMLYQGIIASPKGNPAFLYGIQEFVQSQKPVRSYFMSTDQMYKTIGVAVGSPVLKTGLNSVLTSNTTIAADLTHNGKHASMDVSNNNNANHFNSSSSNSNSNSNSISNKTAASSSSSSSAAATTKVGARHERTRARALRRLLSDNNSSSSSSSSSISSSSTSTAMSDSKGDSKIDSKGGDSNNRNSSDSNNHGRGRTGNRKASDTNNNTTTTPPTATAAASSTTTTTTTTTSIGTLSSAAIANNLYQFDYFLFQEKGFPAKECYDGVDRYGGCNFICRGDQKVLKVRYADYPWHPKPFPQSLVDTPLGRSLKYKYHSIVGGVKEGICSALGTSDGGGGRVDGRGVIIASDAKTTPANTNTNTNANANSSEPSASSKTHNNTAGTIVKG